MIRIFKSERRLEYTDGSEHFSCPVMLGANPEGHKQREGDGRTPEGVYRVCTVNRESKFHISLGLSYPNARDAREGFREKRIGLAALCLLLAQNALGLRPCWKTALGGFVMIHGESPDGKSGDWTQGCAAVSNKDIEALASKVKKGEKVEILP